MPGARTAPIDATARSQGAGRRRAVDRRHRRTGPPVWPVWLSEDRGAVARGAGWVVNDKRVERIWRREGLKVPQRQPKRGRLWLADGSCLRLRAERRNHVWSYDFVEDRTHEGRKYRMLERDRRVHARMPGDPDRPKAEVRRRDRRLVGSVPPSRRPRTHPFGQWPGVRGQGRARLDRGGRGQTAYYAPGSPWENKNSSRTEIRFFAGWRAG